MAYRTTNGKQKQVGKEQLVSAEQVVVKGEFTKILLDYSKDVIKADPEDIVSFSRQYFQDILEESGYFADHAEKVEVESKSLIYRIGEKVDKIYDIGEIVGDPQYSKAYKARNKITGEIKAVKIQKKSKISNWQQWIKQIELICQLDHPSLLSYTEIYEDDTSFYLVADLMHSELWAYMAKQKKFSENEAAHITIQMLSALAYLHNNGIVHRNIRPSNILVIENGKWDIKLIDFDFAKALPSGHKFYEKMGDVAPYYDAPEVFKGEYDEKCDIWSAGCMLYILLSGKMPFFTNGTMEELAELISIGQFDLESDIWNHVSQDAKDLIRQLLSYDPEGRPNAVDAQQHPWFTHHYKKGALNQRQLGDALSNLASFNADTRLKQGVVAFFTKSTHSLYEFLIPFKFLMTKKERDELTAQFSAIDVNGDGTISREELVNAYKKLKGDEYSEEEVDDIIRNVDSDGNGVINYSEWTMAAVNKQRLLERKKLEQAFSMFDQDGDRKVSNEEIAVMFAGLRNIDEDAVQRALDSIETKGSTSVSFQEFVKLIESLFE